MKHWSEVLLEKFRNPESLRNFGIYLSIACAGVASNLFTATFLRRSFGVNFGSSIVLGYLTGMVLGFFLTKAFAFNARHSGNATREAIKFFMVSMVALSVTWFFSEVSLRVINAWFVRVPVTQSLLEALVKETSNGFSGLLGINLSLSFIDRQLFANLGGIGFGFFANFFGHKYFTFKTTGLFQRYFAKFRSGTLP
jgi:putative flippase GtrA